MDPDFIERLIRIVEQSSVAELEYSEGGAALRIVKTANGTARAILPTEENSTADAEPAITSEITEQDLGRGHVIAAGIIGMFYRAPSPGEPPFVEVGDLVEDGQTLGILEAMKTLNPVEADRAGRIAEILQEDGMAVEAGTALFVIAAAE